MCDYNGLSWFYTCQTINHDELHPKQTFLLPYYMYIYTVFVYVYINTHTHTHTHIHTHIRARARLYLENIYMYIFILCSWRNAPRWRHGGRHPSVALSAVVFIFLLVCPVFSVMKLLFQLWGIIKLQIQYCFD